MQARARIERLEYALGETGEKLAVVRSHGSDDTAVNSLLAEAKFDFDHPRNLVIVIRDVIAEREPSMIGAPELIYMRDMRA